MGNQSGLQMTPAGKPPVATALKSALLPKKIALGFFAEETLGVDVIANENIARAQYMRLVTIVTFEAVAIIVLTLLIVLSAPFVQPVYQYFALNPAQQRLALTPLTMPNMTNRAVLSWATTGVTEIMTIGFGDFEAKLLAQKNRFTPDGWDAFVRGFLRLKIGETFKENQLVLTTVPSDTPVITSQGENEQHVYEWHVEMPVVMTYATNNNVTKQEKTIIDLVIIRVPATQNPSGIAIQTWKRGSM